MKPTITIIGAGRLGKTLGRLIQLQQAGEILAIQNQTLASAQEAVDFIEAGEALAPTDALPTSDIILVCVADDVIASVAAQLANTAIVSGAVVAHCSGALPAEILSPVKQAGGMIASVHPIRSIADPNISVTQFNPTYCAFEGDACAFSILKALFEAIGGRVFTINPSEKAQYHAGLCMAADYVVSLADMAMQALGNAGVERELAKAITTELMSGTVENIAQLNTPAQALTGPIVRGDIETVSSHIQKLSGDDLGHLYKVLGQVTLGLTPHEAAVRERFQQLFQ